MSMKARCRRSSSLPGRRRNKGVKMSMLRNIVLLPLLSMVLPVAAQQGGKDVYTKACVTCHATGIAGAPRYGNVADWSPRLAAGTAKLYQSALNGTLKGMPPKGGHSSLSDAETKAAVDYMLAAVKNADKAARHEAPKKKDEAPKAETRKDSPGQEAASKGSTAKNDDRPPATASQPLPSAAALPVIAASAAKPATPPAALAEVNAFNRLLKPPALRNPAPVDDGIHDPANDGTLALQPPLEVFEHLPKSNAGNRVNWVEALRQKKITPRYDRVNPNAEPVIMDLNIVREVKGSMPDVVYPHKQHTEWLDCSNCHPAIFIPQKGANSISMAAILLGEKCGVCHGKVAFPVSECRSCHAKKKDVVARPAASAPGK